MRSIGLVLPRSSRPPRALRYLHLGVASDTVDGFTSSAGSSLQGEHTVAARRAFWLKMHYEASSGARGKL